MLKSAGRKNTMISNKEITLKEGRTWSQNKCLRDHRASCAFRPEYLGMVLLGGNYSWIVALLRKMQANKVTTRIEMYSLVVGTK